MNNESFFWGPVHPLDLSSSFIVYFGGLGLWLLPHNDRRTNLSRNSLDIFLWLSQIELVLACVFVCCRSILHTMHARQKVPLIALSLRSSAFMADFVCKDNISIQSYVRDDDVISAHSYSTHLTVSNCYLLFFYADIYTTATLYLSIYYTIRWTDLLGSRGGKGVRGTEIWRNVTSQNSILSFSKTLLPLLLT